MAKAKDPDYPDVDKDGNRKESMESAVRNAKAKKAKAKKQVSKSLNED